MYDPATYILFFLPYWSATNAEGVGVGSQDLALFTWIRNNNALGEVFMSPDSCSFGMAAGVGSDGVDQGVRAGIQASLIMGTVGVG